MKKLLFLFLGISCSLATMAQNNPEGNSNVTNRMPKDHNLEGGGDQDNSGFGIKGGVNFNQLRGSDKSGLQDLNNKTSWHAGIYGQFQVAGSRFFSIQTEALFDRKSFEVADTVRKMDFLEIPLLFVFNVFDNVSFHVGPQAGVLLTVQENEQEVGEFTKKKMNSFVYGIDAGAEAKISFARVGARYYLGLNDIYKNPENLGNQTVTDLKNGTFQVYVGFGFE
jgi:hypothetical protein